MHLKSAQRHWFLIVPEELRSMKYCVLLFGIFLFSCGGTLSEEQRKRMKEQMELHKIRRVTDVELTEAAFAKGRTAITSVQDIKTDSLENARGGKVRWLTASNPGQTETEKQLFEAYQNSESTTAQDNVQKLRRGNGEDSDSILYTKPVFSKDNGTEKLIGVWSIWLSRKQLILEMPKKK